VIEDASTLGAGLSPSLLHAYTQIYEVMVDEIGCEVYVKTIYVGFTIGGAMVAAVYPRSDCLEVAMALPEDVEGSEFIDATHLTWPTMPVAVSVSDAADLPGALDHLRNAAERVSAGHHDVRRPNEHFIGRVRRGNSRPS
jgi:hypothetical protein